MAQNEKLNGVVEWYTIHRGYGVIKGDDGNGYFVRFGDALNAIEYGLQFYPRVSFYSKPREFGKGLQAIEVEIADVSSKDKISFFLSDEGVALRRQGFMKVRRWNLWEDYKSEYGEFEDGFDMISQRTGLIQVPTNLNIAQRVFYDDIPDGAWPANYDRARDMEGRMGVHTLFQGNGVNLAVHVFYRNTQRDYVCWRARGYRKFRGKVYDMPAKNPPYSRDPASWRMSFGKFLSDVQDIILRCRFE